MSSSTLPSGQSPCGEAGSEMAERDESAGQIQHIPMETEFKEWGSKTGFGVLAGMLYGGSKEAVGSAHFGQVLAPMQVGKDLKTEVYVERVGGAKSDTDNERHSAWGCKSALAAERNVHDTLNTVAAGSLTVAAWALASTPGSFLTRIRTAAVGSLLGATVCFPLGYLQTKLEQEVEEAKSLHHRRWGNQMASLLQFFAWSEVCRRVRRLIMKNNEFGFPGSLHLSIEKITVDPIECILVPDDGGSYEVSLQPMEGS